MKNTLLNNVNSDISWIRNNTIYITRSGSHSYGTNHSESDEDFRGITIPPKEYFIGPSKVFEQLDKHNPDLVIFNLLKFIKLATQNNPNVLELLFTDSSDHIFIDSLGEELIDNRNLFLSKLCKERFLGYAKAQAHRIKLHRGYLLNPPIKFPERKDFNLKEKYEIPKEQLEAIWSQINKQLDIWNPDFEPFSEAQKIWLQRNLGKMLAEMNIYQDNSWMCAARSLEYSENFILLLHKEREYAAAKKGWENYQEWKKNRNPKRAALEAKYLVDLKHALHLIRLSRMAKEILEQGKVIVKRPDAEELKSILNGAWTYEQIIEYMEKMEVEIKIAYDKSPLPKLPNIKKIDNLCIKLIEKSLSKYSWFNVKKTLTNLIIE